MSGKELTSKEGLTPSGFIEQLNRTWGGELFLGFNPQFNSLQFDIEGKAYSALFEIAKTHKENYPQVRSIVVPRTGSLAKDFQRVISQDMPHSERTKDRIYMLSDVPARSVLTDRLELFLKLCGNGPIDTGKDYLIEDKLPYRLFGGKVLFDTPNYYPTLRGYFDEAITKAPGFAYEIGLNEEETARFTNSFTNSMYEFGEACFILEHNDPVKAIQDFNLHPSLALNAFAALVCFKTRPPGHRN